MRILNLNQSGFSLLEIMIVITIAGLLTAVALPSYQNMVKNNCMTTSTNTLVTTLQQARSEAVKRQTTVTVTAGNTGDASNEWGTGWTITINEDRNGNGTLDTNEDYDGDGVLDAAATVKTVTLTCSVTTINGNNNSYSYLRTGFISSPANSPGTFDVCDDRTGETGRQVSISTVGRPNTNSNYTGCS